MSQFEEGDLSELHDFTPTTRIQSEHRQMQMLDIQLNVHDDTATLPVSSLL